MPSEMIPLDSLRNFHTLMLSPMPISAERFTLMLQGYTTHGEVGYWSPLLWRAQDSTLAAFPSMVIAGVLPWGAWRTFLRLCRPTDEVFYKVEWDAVELAWVFRFVLARGEKILRFLLAAAREEWVTGGEIEQPSCRWGRPLSQEQIDLWRHSVNPLIWPSDYIRGESHFHDYVLPCARVGCEMEEFYAVSWDLRTPLEVLRPGDGLRVIRHGVPHGASTVVYTDYLQVERQSGLVSRILTFPVAYHFSPVEWG